MDNKGPDNQVNNRDLRGRFVKGVSGNPKGKPVGIKDFSISDLIDAIKEVEEEKKMPLYKKFVNKAYVNSAVMIALIKKLIPDKTHAEIEIPEDPENAMAKARESLKKKLDDISKRLGDIDHIRPKESNEKYTSRHT